MRDKMDMKTDTGKVTNRESVISLTDMPSLRCNALKLIDGALSAYEKSDNSDSAERIAAQLDIFLSVVQNEKNEISWNNFGFEIGNLALRMLLAIEKTDNFQIHLSKLISSMCIISTRTGGAWRQFIRPLLNVFTNKKLDYIHLKQSVKGFKNLSKCADKEELKRFTEQNLHLLQGFSMLAFNIGDFQLQMDILEIVFIYTSRKRSLVQAILPFGNEKTRQLIETLDFSDFQKDSRMLLNEMNSGFGSQRRIYTINCNLVYFGNVPLSSPLGIDGIWLDFNKDSRKITISCSNFLPHQESSESIILQLPLSRIEKLKVEFGSLSNGDCFCITVRTNSLKDVYEFASADLLVCTGLMTRNPREAVEDFVRVMEELSPEIREHSQQERTNQLESRNKTGCPKSKSRASCTSPIVFTTGGTDENGWNAEQNMRQMGMTSPLTLLTCSKYRIETFQSEAQGGKFSSMQQESNILTQKVFSSHIETSSCQILRENGRSERNCIFHGNEHLQLNFGKLDFGRSTGVSDAEMVEEKEENKREGTDYAQRVCEDWESYCEDFILTQEFKLEENNKENIAPASSLDDTLQGESKSAEGKNRNKSRKKGCPEAEERVYTSLLDPNGYAFKRWLRPTTSDRSNFWMKKIKDLEKVTCKSEANVDVFNFTDESEFSDDFNIFRKEKTARRKKLVNLTGRECVKFVKSSESRKQELFKEEKKRPKIVGAAKSKPSGKLNSQICEQKRETNMILMNSDGRIGDRRGILDILSPEHPCHLPDTFPDEKARLQTSGKSKNVRESVGRRRRAEQEGKHDKKRNPYWNIDDSYISPGVPVRNKKQIIGDFEELTDIAQRLSSGFREGVQDIIDRKVNETRTYANETMTRLNKLAEEEKLEMESKSNRFKSCIQYYIEGCSVSDSEDVLLTEMEKMVEKIKELASDEKPFVEKAAGLAGQLKETIAAEVTNTFNKDMKLVRLRQLENFLSNQSFLEGKHIF